MNVSLTAELEELIRRKVESGMYGSASEVVREALRLLEERDRLARLRAAITVAEEQVARGEIIPWTPDLMEQLKGDAEEETRLGLPIRDEVLP